MEFYGPDPFSADGGTSGIMRCGDVDHARQRRLMSAAFSDKSLREQEPLLRKYVDVLVSKLSAESEQGKAKVNMVDWYNFTTFDIMADLTFGEPLHLLDRSKYTPWVKGVFSVFKVVTIGQIARAIPGMDTVLQSLIPKSAREMRKMHNRHSIDRVDKRLQMKTDRPDIWTYVLRFSNSEENKDRALSLTEMYSNASTFMMAGTETTSTLMSGLTYLLLSYPDCMSKLVAQLRRTFPTRESINIQQLASMEYLNACVEEALRVYPPLPSGMTRVVPAQGATICNEHIAGGVSI